MNTKISIAFIVGLIVGTFLIWMALPRYSIVITGAGNPIRYDRFTGKTWMMKSRQWEPLEVASGPLP